MLCLLMHATFHVDGLPVDSRGATAGFRLNSLNEAEGPFPMLVRFTRHKLKTRGKRFVCSCGRWKIPRLTPLADLAIQRDFIRHSFQAPRAK